MNPATQETDSRAGRAVAIAALVALGAAACLVVWAVLAGPPWVLGAVTSRMFLVCGGVTIACAVLICLICRVLWRAGAAERARRREQDGQIILEFAMAMPILLLIVLIMAQSTMLMAGNVCVHYAAYCAARTAVVTVPLHMADEPQNFLAEYEYPSGSEKMRRVHESAAWALMPFSCGSDDVAPDDDAEVLEDGLAGLFDEYGRDVPRWAVDYLSRKLNYARGHTVVTVDPPRPEYGDWYRANSDLHVTVTHELYLSVPYASRVFAALSEGRELTELAEGEYALEVTVQSHLTNEGEQDYIEIEEFPRPG